MEDNNQWGKKNRNWLSWVSIWRHEVVQGKTITR